MQFLLQDKIFEYFGLEAKAKDSFKDVDGKGIWERYNESVSIYYDENISKLIDLFFENVYISETMYSSLIPTVERTIGSPVIILEDGNPINETYRRKVIKFIHKIYNIRGTELSYQVLLGMLGFENVTINEYVEVSGFDSDITFDDEIRTFDSVSTNSACREYSITSTGALTLTGEIIQGVARIVEFLEPINARLRDFTYNGDVVEIDLILVKIIDGVLVYDNTNDPQITLELIDGVLYKDGISAAFYVLQNGLLIYTKTG